jgi:hypothetical protein
MIEGDKEANNNFVAKVPVIKIYIFINGLYFAHII